jgi:hypothetical protein
VRLGFGWCCWEVAGLLQRGGRWQLQAAVLLALLLAVCCAMGLAARGMLHTCCVRPLTVLVPPFTCWLVAGINETYIARGRNEMTISSE